MTPKCYLSTVTDREGHKVETRTTWLGNRVIWFFFEDSRIAIHGIARGGGLR